MIDDKGCKNVLMFGRGGFANYASYAIPPP
jgi:hypothetical protein